MTDELQATDGARTVDSRRARWEDTLALLTKRIEDDPSNVDAWYNRGVALRLLVRDYNGAARNLDEALRRDPSSVRAHLGRGDLYLDAGDTSAAITEYNTAIDLAPADPMCYDSRGRGYAEQNQHAEAIADFTKAADLRPGWATPYFHRALAREGIEDYAGAISDYEMFFSLEHECAELVSLAHGLRAFLHMKLRSYKEAIADYSERLRLTPGDALSYLGRSRAHKMVGDRTRAAEDLKRALEIDPAILEKDEGAEKRDRPDVGTMGTAEEES